MSWNYITLHICEICDNNWTFSVLCPQYWHANETCVYDADCQHGLPELTSRSAGALALDERWEMHILVHTKVYKQGILPTLVLVQTYFIEQFNIVPLILMLQNVYYCLSCGYSWFVRARKLTCTYVYIEVKFTCFLLSFLLFPCI